LRLRDVREKYGIILPVFYLDPAVNFDFDQGFDLEIRLSWT
jgi:hypothetical protein